MAKQSIVAVIRAKPNARGKTSHIPFTCNTKGCNGEAIVHTGEFDKRKKVCYDCFENPPQSQTTKAKIIKLRSMGLIR